MNTSLDHLPEFRREELSLLTRIIAGTIRPEKIILFGLHALTGGLSEPALCRELSHCLDTYDLLVVTRKGDRRYEYEVQDMIENRCKRRVSATVLVHDIDYVNAQLLQGSYFFSMVQKEGILLFDAGRVPLEESRPPDLVRIRILAEKDFGTWQARAEAFFKSADFNNREKQWKLAAFLLHQAAESAYQAILLAFTGYKPCTHNLDKLRKYTNRFSLALTLVFPRNDQREEHLFRQLQNAYVDARYKDEYTVSEDEVALLLERVGDLLSVGGRICRNRFTSLARMGTRQKEALGLAS